MGLALQVYVVGARCRLLVARTSSSIWVNLLLKCRDAVLGKLKDNVSFDSVMELCNTAPSSSYDLFPRDSLDKVVEKSSRILHEEAIRKVVSL